MFLYVFVLLEFEHLNYIWLQTIFLKCVFMYYMDETKRVEVPMDKESPGDKTYQAKILVARLWSGRTSRRYSIPLLNIESSSSTINLSFNHPLFGNIFAQSILRQANFKGAKLLGASFFDADLTGLFVLFSFCWK